MATSYVSELADDTEQHPRDKAEMAGYSTGWRTCGTFGASHDHSDQDPEIRKAEEKVDEELWLDAGALQAGARALFLKAIKTHKSACDAFNKFTREDGLQHCDGTDR